MGDWLIRRKFKGQISPALMQMVQAFVWSRPLEPGLFIAVYVDLGLIPESVMRQCLTSDELAKADMLTNLAERRHFLVRRCFQRLFVCMVTGWRLKPQDLKLDHRLDTQPDCVDFPLLHLSFSTSGITAAACASETQPVGIDVERDRDVENVVELARRFFSQKEADAIAAVSVNERSHQFLLHWTTKEAGLKAIGRGIASGLNTFCLERSSPKDAYLVIGPPVLNAAWELRNIDMLPNHIISLIKQNSVDKL